MEDIGVALFTYCRPVHTQMVIDSLRENKFKKIYLFQDGLKSETDRQEWKKVTDVITHSGLPDAEIHISKINKGLANSIIEGINYVIERHEGVIALEDDVVLGDGYAKYMHECFGKYRENKSVCCIAGCGCPVEIPSDYQYDAFFSYRASSAAWGTWKDRWKQYKQDFEIYREILTDEEKRRIFQKSGGDIKGIVFDLLAGKIDSWATFWTLMQINQKGVCVLPTRYLAQDIGHDGIHGTNSLDKTSRFDTKLYSLKENQKLSLPDDIIIEDSIINQIHEVLSISDEDKKRAVTDRLLRKWIDALHDKEKPVAKYLKMKGISSIYIYGAGDIAKKVIDEISKDIQIEGIIVLDKTEDQFCGYPVYEFSDTIDLERKFILITPVYDYIYIETSLKKRFHSPDLINLEDSVTI